ncbi:MAG: hypothetical protein RIS94_772 [Pseudomonadota bacterium]|jgi:3-deoxy-manno-octulosonate cytidylyltransferase (CMP-KDO synthetase)
MKVLAVIPARYGSSRFEGKPLADIAGAPMIAWVYHRVTRSERIARVVVATDDDRIARACEEHGLEYIMTRTDHGTSTERLHEVAQKIDADLYLCVNGDEPLIDVALLESLIPAEVPPRDEIYVANIAAKIKSAAEVIDPTNIKVVFSSTGCAQFMSRSPIPHPKSSLDFDYYKHVGVLIYNHAALDFFAKTPRGSNERIEDVNELRFIENGVPLNMILAEAGDGLSVDTPKDLMRIRSLVAEQGIKLK